MNMPSGAPEDPPDLGLNDERRAKGSRDIMAFDIETVPQRNFWPVARTGESRLYDIDPYWLERHDQTETDEAVENLSAPYALTGQIPACHPTTAHVVSVSCGLLGAQGSVNVETVQFDELTEQVEVKGRTDGRPEIEMRPRRLEEYSDVQLFDAERATIRRAWELISWALDRGLTIVTFNGKQFDMPMLRWRSVLLSLKIPKISWYEMLYRYRHKEHVDIRLLISDGDTRAKGTLAMWCEAFGIDADDSGELVFPWAKRGKWDEIRRYGGKEMRSLVDLYHRVEGAL